MHILLVERSNLLCVLDYAHIHQSQLAPVWVDDLTAWGAIDEMKSASVGGIFFTERRPISMTRVVRLDLKLLGERISQAASGISVSGDVVQVRSLRVLQSEIKEFLQRKIDPSVAIFSYALVKCIDDVFQNVFGDIPYNEATARFRARVAIELQASLQSIAATIDGHDAQIDEEFSTLKIKIDLA